MWQELDTREKFRKRSLFQKIEKIEDHIHLAKEKSKTDAEFYKIQKQAEANRLLFTQEYLELKKYEAAATNRKVYFGPQLPNIYFASDQDASSSEKQAVLKQSGDN